MDPSAAAVPRSAHRYRLPALLQDIRLLDLLEISGTTFEVSRVCGLSQPTVSRRTRALAADFGLQLKQRRRAGCSIASSAALRFVRLGCRAHRLAAGVARLGADGLLQPLLGQHPWLLPAPPRFRPMPNWLELVQQGVLDGALVWGLEGWSDGASPADGLELLALAPQPLDLVMSAHQPAPLEPPPVLVPQPGVAPALHAALVQRRLVLQTAPSHWQLPSQWLQRLQRERIAMPCFRVKGEPPLLPLQRCPLPDPLHLPLWLVLPAEWRQQTVLRQTAAQLGYRLPAAPQG